MFKTYLLTSMAKVMPSASESDFFIPEQFSCFLNEKLCFQIAYTSDKNMTVRFETDADDCLKIYKIGFTPALYAAAPNADDYYISKEPGLYPDILYECETSELKSVYSQFRTLFFEFTPEKAGAKVINIFFYDGDELVSSQTVDIEVIDCDLPKQDVVCTLWFHTDCLADWYKTEVFSDEYWRIVKNYMLAAAEHSIYSLLVPLFTPPLDTAVGSERRTVQLVDVSVDAYGNYTFGFDKVKKWINISKECGIEYFEFSHFFTQWGAYHAPKIVAEKCGETVRIFGWETDSLSDEYISFLESFAAAFKPVIEELGIGENCLFHVSDEPGDDVIEQYEKCSDVIHRLFGEYKIIDALSSYEFYKRGIVKNPVVCVDHIDDFIGNCDDLWVYYCCGPSNGYFTNRFIAMPSQRTRVLGMQMYKYSIKGFLQWAFNFWYSQLSKSKVNPYLVSDADGSFPAGDAFVVYPGDNGEPVSSLRLKVFRDAFYDLRALKLLESKAGRDYAVDILDSESEITFSSYPRSEEWHFDKRNKINYAIKNLTK